MNPLDKLKRVTSELDKMMLVWDPPWPSPVQALASELIAHGETIRVLMNEVTEGDYSAEQMAAVVAFKGASAAARARLGRG